ncbi:gamma-glutamyltransferase family protein [Ancylobacter amanitiformis]|uniref:Gamma-glutamyltranspeptidase/glutathione hydrolase n=1 Tax=Ancylobacter amanitiformis TaxID=217069 RepID=A0ABU0LLP3_9HYPH|nr:gamma-glutamyltransferase family protein [Ancylobacter amanitiformis]MDQ0509622.1 gamma-glutamyltranspeptidase/glutathione hydrolase [Ancylobacter amanitiformis]
MENPFTTRPEIKGTFGVVTSTHWIASAVGMSILERGGNAFDAAVATGFVLQIVEPHLNGPGGEVPILFWKQGEDEPQVLCGQGVAPAAATIEHFEGLGLRLVPGTGLLPAVVPGSFDAWMLLLRDHGTLDLETVLEPAIFYAREGFPLVRRAVQAIHAVEEFFPTEWPTSAQVWLPGGRRPTPDALFRTPAIGDTYRRICDEAKAAGGDRVAQIEAARHAFYRGFVAEAIDGFYRENALMDTSGRKHAGLLTGDDMAGWQASYERPVSYDYAGARVYKTGPWGQGPVFLQMLALLKGYDIAAMDPLGDDYVHLITECTKLAMADRDVFYGDPDFVEVPLDVLLSDEYNAERRRLIGREASLDIRPGALPGAEAGLAALLERAGCETPIGPGMGEPTFVDLPEVEGDTVHFDIIDRWGNVVCATPSGGWLQSSPVVPELGFPLSTRAQMFWLDRRLSSALAPGKRPRTTLSPTMVGRDGKPWLALGTPGGDQQDQWSSTVLLRHLHHRFNLQAAIDAPLFNTRHGPASFYPRARAPGELLIESRFPQQTLERLAARGHRLKIEGPWALGRVCAAGISGGMLHAGATPRFMQGYAIGR